MLHVGRKTSHAVTEKPRRKTINANFKGLHIHAPRRFTSPKEVLDCFHAGDLQGKRVALSFGDEPPRHIREIKEVGKMLGELRNLEHLELGKTSLSSKMVPAITDGLSKTEKVKTVVMYNCNLMVSHDLALFFKAFEKMEGLDSLFVYNQTINPSSSKVALESLVLREKYVRLEKLNLMWEKQIRTRFYRFSRLVNVSICLIADDKHLSHLFLLKTMSHCTQLKKASIEPFMKDITIVKALANQGWQLPFEVRRLTVVLETPAAGLIGKFLRQNKHDLKVNKGFHHKAPIKSVLAAIVTERETFPVSVNWCMEHAMAHPGDNVGKTILFANHLVINGSY